MKTLLTLFIATILAVSATAQTPYADSISRHRTAYINSHEVVQGDDRKYMQFFTPDSSYRVWATVEKKEGTPWFPMTTSMRMKQNYRVYAILHFSIRDTSLQLPIYQSQDLMGVTGYKDYLFLPFTDGTTGAETYEVGRYIDLTIGDLQSGRVLLDFNKAYNPYCAYVSDRYSCPIPPAANQLPLAIRAGEKKFGKH